MNINEKQSSKVILKDSVENKIIKNNTASSFFLDGQCS